MTINIPAAYEINIILRDEDKTVYKGFAENFEIKDNCINIFEFDGSYFSFNLNYYSPLFLGTRKEINLNFD